MFSLVNQTQQALSRQARGAIHNLGQCADILGEVYFPMDGDDGDISKMIMYDDNEYNNDGTLAIGGVGGVGGTSLCCSAPVLTWRGDPEFTHSDWTIIVATSEMESRTYHVHQSILSTGPRRSKYFAKLFQQQHQENEDDHDLYDEGQTRKRSKKKKKKKKSAQNTITRIELDEQDADSFPLLLDFIYNVGSQKKAKSDSLKLVVGDGFTPSNAVSVRHLATIFDCNGLLRAVNKYIQKDLSLKTGPFYLAEAFSYEDKRLLESAKQLCLENFPRLDPAAILRFPLPLFRLIITPVMKVGSKLSKSQDDVLALSYHLSDIVCQYFEKHRRILSSKALLELTDETIIPHIAPEAAIGFTALTRDLDSTEIGVGGPAASEEWTGMIALCERCAEAVVKEYGWKDFHVASALQEYLNGPCANERGSTKIDSLLFATSLAAALERAQHDAKASSSSSTADNRPTEDSSNSVSMRRRDGDEEVDSDLIVQSENSELRAENREMKKELATYEDDLADASEEIRRLKKQLKDFKRKQGVMIVS